MEQRHFAAKTVTLRRKASLCPVVAKLMRRSKQIGGE
jgi:hypothetical protein